MSVQLENGDLQNPGVWDVLLSDNSTKTTVVSVSNNSINQNGQQANGQTKSHKGFLSSFHRGFKLASVSTQEPQHVFSR